MHDTKRFHVSAYDVDDIGRREAGYIGESFAYRLVSRSTVITGYQKTLRNISVPFGNKGHKTEIDVLLIHETGLYVIEAKNFRGGIRGKLEWSKWILSQKDRNWDANRGVIKKPVKNPIIQNEMHIKALRRYLKDVYSHDIVSVIVFGSDCRIWQVPKNTKNRIITSQGELTHEIQKLVMQREVVLTVEDIDRLYERVKRLTCDY